MISLHSLTLAAAALTALAFPPTALAGTSNCDDPSGKIILSGQGCAKSGSIEAGRVDPGDIEDDSPLRKHILEHHPIRTEEDAASTVILLSEGESGVRPVQKTAGDASNLCKEAPLKGAPLKGAQNGALTPSQLAVAACAGITSESVNPTISDEYKKKPQAKPQPPQQPSMITNCDPVGCWDNQGQRYNGKAGTPYLRQDGKVCQSVAGIMQCH